MVRRIVLIRGEEPLQEGWRRRAFGPAGALLDSQIRVAGAMFDEAYHPVPVAARIGPLALGDRPAASGFSYARRGMIDTYAVRVEFENEDAIARLRRDRAGALFGVFADPAVSVCPSPYCGEAPVGDTRDVARCLGVAALQRVGLTGRGVHLAVVDTGIDRSRSPVAGGWAATPGYVPGSSRPDHGTMTAYDARIAAPEAEIFDYALLKSHAGTWSAFLSDPIGSSENYSANPDHPFNQITGSLVAAGADVFFAAGNCGVPCPDARCGAGDTGPGQSIHGANSHPDVVTVAAVTVTDRRLGYSSQGPGGLDSRKPDLAGLSQFAGSGIGEADSGTSAASPVAAGVAAALRQRFPADRLGPAQLRGLLQRTARDLGGDGWDYDLGYGVVDAAAAVKALGLKPAVSRGARRAGLRRRHHAGS